MNKQFIIVHTTGFWTPKGKIEEDPETVVLNIDHIISVHHEGVAISTNGGFFITESEHARICELLVAWRP